MEVGRRNKSVGCATSNENIVSEALIDDRPHPLFNSKAIEAARCWQLVRQSDRY